MAYLVQILLPLFDNNQRRFPKRHYAEIAALLTDTFGGLTAYNRAPAEGLWKDGPARTQRDDIVVYEVMVKALNRKWWRRFRRDLESHFRQDAIVIRAQAIKVL